MKSDIEKKFDEKAKKYKSIFGVNYPVFVTGNLSFEDHIKRIDGAIKTNTPVKIELAENAIY